MASAKVMAFPVTAQTGPSCPDAVESFVGSGMLLCGQVRFLTLTDNQSGESKSFITRMKSPST